jgi:predicted nucleic acid-binding protein
MSRVPRVVLDTNVVLSALVFAHRAAAIGDAMSRQCDPPV